MSSADSVCDASASFDCGAGVMNPNPSPSTSIAYLSSNPNFTNPNSDLSTTLSSLNKLVQLSHDTHESLAGLVTPLKSKTPLIQCPFDPRHLMPPHSLFLHYLRCPSSPRPLHNLNDLLQSLTYPKSLKSSDESRHDNLFLQTLDDPAAELCFSLDDYVHSAFNFFYRDCPGVVTSSYADPTNNRTFTLPGYLSVECSNFIGATDTDADTTNPQRRIFPSEYWTIRNEVQAWNDYPATYSYGVLRTMSGVRISKESNLLAWIIANSPRFGVILDIAMQQHIFLLFSLCMKSILREASSLMDVSTKEQTLDSNLAAMSTRCPIMLQALTWLASQLSILYGATNGKLFVLHLLKLCILDGASCLLLFPFEQKFTEATGLREEFQNSDTSDRDIKDVKFDLPVEQNTNPRQDNNEDGTVCSRKIFVSQVAAAIAALHERSILEDRIKGLWFSQQPTRYQLLAEHCYVSEKANEERKSRPDYRPVIDHDGLARQQSSKQDSTKEKTREELLAEERDYKRRRMSYRGKKIKRSALQVTRDIIEDYMEEIKQAGGIEAQVKESQGETFPCNAYSGNEKIIIEAKNLRKVNHDSPDASACVPSYYERQSHTNYFDKRKAVEDDSSRDYAQSRHGQYKKHGFVEDQWCTDDEYDREYASRSTERYRSHSRSHDHSHHRKKQDYSNKNYDRKSRSSDRWRSYMQKNHGSDSPLKNAFEDRYDPSESTDICDDDISSSTKCSKPVKFYAEKFH